MSMTAIATNVRPFLSRWSIPLSGLLLTLMGGISYAWGVFVVPLQEVFGWTRAQAVLPVSVYLFFFPPIGLLLGGYLQDKYGPRKIASIGGILFFLAYLMASQIERFPYVWWLLLSYGVLGGIGSGFAYCVAVPSARKWFPDRTALAVTVSVTGFGLAATFFAPWITRLIRTVGIADTFLALAIVTSSVALFAAWLQRVPPAGWVPQGWEGFQAGTSAAMYAARREATLREALKSGFFYLQWLGFFCVIFGGLMAMAHLVPYGVSILKMEKPAAAVAMVYFGLANGFGRTIAGIIAEKTGPVQVMLVTYIITGISFLLFNTVVTTPSTLYACALIFGWGFAVTLGLMPVLTTVVFGSQNLGAIYGAVKTAFGVAALLGPMAAAWAYDVTQSYALPFAAAGILSLVGWCICLAAFRLKYRLP